MEKQQTHERAIHDLARALALNAADSFQLLHLVCSWPRSLDAALEAIVDAYQALSDTPLDIHRINPYDTLDPAKNSAVDYETLVLAVLEPLAEHGPLAPDKAHVFVLDVTNYRATDVDKPVWQKVFGRMNELRNAITARWPGTLILAMPEELQTLFAHNAPDFWSIRTLYAKVEEHAGEPSSVIDFSEQVIAEVVSSHIYEKIQQAREAAEAAWKRHQENPDDLDVARAFVVRLTQLAEAYRALDRPSLALMEYNKAAKVLRPFVARYPNRTDLLQNLIVCLGNSASLQKSLGRAEARDTAAEGVKLAQKLIAIAPDNMEAARGLAIMLQYAGDIAAAQGKYEIALEVYKECVQRLRHLLTADPQRPDLKHDLCLLLNKWGDMLRKCGNNEQALNSYNEALQLAQKLTQVSPSNLIFLRAVMIGYGKIADVLATLGRLNEALKYYDKGLEIARQLFEKNLELPEAKRDIEISLLKKGELQRVRGELPAAEEAIAEALRIARDLAHAAPGHPRRQQDLANALATAAQLHESKGDFQEAFTFFQEAQAIYKNLLQAHPEYRGFLNNVQQCSADLERLTQRLSAQQSPPNPQGRQ